MANRQGDVDYALRASLRPQLDLWLGLAGLARFETLVPLVTLRTAQTILSIGLLQHLKSLRKSFSQFETEFDANALILKILHFPTCKKSPRLLNIHSFKRAYLDD